MTVLLLLCLFALLLGIYRLVQATRLGEVPPITDEEWEDWKAFARRRDARHAR